MKKKRFQKLFSFLLACMLMVSMMTIEASAAPNDTTGLDPDLGKGSLTLVETIEGKDSTYTAYQVLKADVIPGLDKYDYNLTDAFKGAQVTVDEISKATGGSNDHEISGKLDEIAARLENYVKTHTDITGTELIAGIKSELSIGYYLILETKTIGGLKQTKPMLVAIPGTNLEGKYEYDVTVTIKDQQITTTKTIEESEVAQQDSIAQQVGKVFTFKIVQDVPKYDDTYKNVVFKVKDTMSKGLKFVGDSQKVYRNSEEEQNLIAGNLYGFDKSTDIDSLTVLNFDFSENEGIEGKADYYKNVKDANKIIITYQAQLTKDATFGPSGELNTVVPEFGENPGSTINGTPDKAKAFSGGLKITKKGEKDNEVLQGAEFTVYEDEECQKPAQLVTYTVDQGGNITANKAEELSSTATTDKNGVVRFEGLGAGTYWIRETKAPNGYIQLKDPIKVVVDVTLPSSIENGNEPATFKYTISGNGIENEVISNNGIAEFDVQNTKGFTLPTTGGMGTYIFTIGGVLLIAAAVVLFIRSRKKAD